MQLSWSGDLELTAKGILDSYYRSHPAIAHSDQSIEQQAQSKLPTSVSRRIDDTTCGSYLCSRTVFSFPQNLERDSDIVESLNGYVVTSRALDVVRRIAEVAKTTATGGAWSLTGPYGSGKSSLALLLDAAFGPSGDIRSLALEQIDYASRSVGDAIRGAHELHRTEEKGFLRGIVTGNREPIFQTLSRAIRSAVNRRNDHHRISGNLMETIANTNADEFKKSGQSPSTLVEATRCLARETPFAINCRRIRKEHRSFQ